MLLLSLMLFMLRLLHVQMQPVEPAEPQQQPEEPEPAVRALYDQRQTGKYNIHVSIKDVAIIEVDQNELADDSYNAEDDDYYYDDSALTIKPIKFTTEGSSTTAAATTTTTTAATTTTVAATTPTAVPTPAATVAAVAATPSGNISAYSAQLLADIAATQRQRPKTNNLIIMDSPISSSSTLPTKWLHARSKDEPITTTTTGVTAAAVAPLITDNIEYMPGQGHDSPIFKVKVQRAASATPAETPTRCRSHQFRDAQGKCRSKRSGSILRKLFSMLVSLPFAGNHQRGHGHGLQVSPP